MTLVAVFTTVSTAEQAQKLADLAIERRLAACVHAEPITSTYRWQGEVQHDAEVRLLFKTTAACQPALEQLLLDAHPYELPAIFAVPVTHASAGYEAWVVENTLEPDAEAKP